MPIDQTPRARDEWRSGWPLVLASLCGIVFGVTGLFFYSAGIFLKPVAHEFGWSRTATSAVSLVAALTLAFTAPFVGGIVDRFGTRTVICVSSLGLSLGFWLLGHTPPQLSTYLMLVALAVVLGAGASPVTFTRLINLHFAAARGTALGIAQTATGVAGASLPVLLIPFVARHGWREGYQALALVALVSLPVVLLLLTRLPTGARPTATAHAGSHVTLRQALTRTTFYVIAGMLGLAAVGVGGMIVHLVPLLSDAGLSPPRASAIAGTLGLGIIIGRVSTGFLMDRVFAPRVAFVTFGVASTACGVLAWGSVTWAAPAVLVVGLAMGAEIDLISYLVARYFGMGAYGRIYGWLYAVFMIGTALGPIVAGAAFDRFGNYHVALSLLGAALGLAALATWALPAFPPQRMEAASG